ncbi:extracellular solute-binding protein [Nocardioides panacisoli]|uniref:Extracellular solute-binding protein n=1 Tax=Nocardioides panacisoli TaxID=627624 RepID=A0ABP7HVJ5_9ACTN
MAEYGRFGWRTAVTMAVVAIGVVVGMIVIGNASDSDSRPHPRPTSSGAPSMATLVFATWGSDEELGAYQKIVDAYNERSTVVDVRVVGYSDPETMMNAIDSGQIDPDVFLLRQDDLAATMAAERNQPLQDLMDARGVHVSDSFLREGINAFSAADDLQCMPYTASPMVMYYNKDLIDFDRMARRGQPVPNEDHSSFSLDAFRAAAQYASRPGTHAKGVEIAPTLSGLAPFVYSGSGHLFDDDTQPTSLALGNATDAIRDTLEVLRDPKITLSSEQLERKSALEWFEAGKLGMIAGYRDLTPVLRGTPGLHFDVLPMPSLGSSATIGQMTGVCLAKGPRDRVAQAADFLVDLIGDKAVNLVTKTGATVPANLDVAFHGFLKQVPPAHPRVFTVAQRSIVPPPIDVDWAKLQSNVRAGIEALFTEPVLDDLSSALTDIDDQSRVVLDPSYQPSESPSGSPSGSTDSSAGGSSSRSDAPSDD